MKPKHLTRAQVAAQLGVSKATVRRLEKRKELRPRKGKGDVRLFDPAEVAGVQARSRGMSRGEVASAVFTRFERGEPLGRIVIDLRLDPETVRGLYREFRTPLAEGFAREAREAAEARRAQAAAADRTAEVHRAQLGAEDMRAAMAAAVPARARRVRQDPVTTRGDAGRAPTAGGTPPETQKGPKS